MGNRSVAEQSHLTSWGLANRLHMVGELGDLLDLGGSKKDRAIAEAATLWNLTRLSPPIQSLPRNIDLSKDFRGVVVCSSTEEDHRLATGWLFKTARTVPNTASSVETPTR